MTKIMKSLAVLLFLYLDVTVLWALEGPSTRLLDFASTLSGTYSNDEQVDTDIEENVKVVHDRLFMAYIPVDIQAVPPGIAFYGLEKHEGVVLRKELLVVTEADEKTFVIHRHNFTDPGHFPDDVQTPGDLAKFKPSDLALQREECFAVFFHQKNNVYSGNWPDCINFIKGHPLSYGLTLACGELTVVFSYGNTHETPHIVPYDYSILERFPLPKSWTKGAKGWTPPCDEA